MKGNIDNLNCQDLTEEGQKVYEILKKQQLINAIAAVAIAIAAIAMITYLRLKQQFTLKNTIKKMRRKQL